LSTWPSQRSIGLLRALGVNYVLDWTPVENCHVFAGPVEYAKPGAVSSEKNPCIYEIPPGFEEPPAQSKQLYVPSSVAAGAPFTAYLILHNSGPNAYGVKPTDRASLTVHWDNGATEALAVSLPLVTFYNSVVPIDITAPATAGDHTLRLVGDDAVLGITDLTAQVHVGAELDYSAVLPASVELGQPLPTEIARGTALPVELRWRPYNKINAYYSASLRLVDENGEKKSNVDRQPGVATLLWQPDQPIADTFELPIPPDIPPGTYTIEVLMYQADTDQSALLLDENGTPHDRILLGAVLVK
jgi:hypothetical protein